MTVPGEQVLGRLKARLRDAPAADLARWFEKLDELGPEPFGGENGVRPVPKK